MENKILEIKKTLIEKLKVINSLEDIKQLRAEYNTKSDFFKDLKTKLELSSPEEKSKYGKLISFYVEQINGAILEKENSLKYSFDIEITENLLLTKRTHVTQSKGCLHPLTKVKYLVNQFLNNNDFIFKTENEVEEEKYNFDYLNISKSHLSRKETDTFYTGDNKLLRTHCTTVTSRDLEINPNKTRRVYSIGNVFRNDDNDARHSFQFMQVDLFATGADANISTLKYTIDGLLKFVFGNKSQTKYRISHFPFTEPSFEVDVTCPNCSGQGCQTCSKTGMLEILGCGMLNPKVFEFTMNNKNQIGFAAGIGLERIAMIKGRVGDIRSFYENDLEFIEDKVWSF